MNTRTKIVATLGPACASQNIINKMVRAGVNCVRLNFSHGSHAEHRRLYKAARLAGKKYGEPLAVMQDLRGPKFRVGELSAPVVLRAGQKIILSENHKKSAPSVLSVDFFNCHKHLRPDEKILIDDGKIALKVIKVRGGEIWARVLEGGVVTSNKGINLPDSRLRLPALTKKDEYDLAFGLKLGVDLVALSFVHSAKDIEQARALVVKLSGRKAVLGDQVKIIAKIENRVAVENIEEILVAADGIMVARGDMGVEMPAAQVPIIQKRLIGLALKAAKPVIVATQMLDSMREHQHPTRAEVSDIANAVIDHTDAVMLSNETAAGKYPSLTVATMSEIVKVAEESAYDDLPLPKTGKTGKHVDDAIVDLSRTLAEEVDARLVLAASLTGETGRMISQLRPEKLILVATHSERARRQLNLSWGVRPFVLPVCRSIEELVQKSLAYIKKEKLAKRGDKMIVVAGEPVGEAGKVNLVEVREVI